MFVMGGDSKGLQVSKDSTDTVLSVTLLPTSCKPSMNPIQSRTICPYPIPHTCETSLPCHCHHHCLIVVITSCQPCFSGSPLRDATDFDFILQIGVVFVTRCSFIVMEAFSDRCVVGEGDQYYAVGSPLCTTVATIGQHIQSIYGKYMNISVQ